MYNSLLTYLLTSLRNTNNNNIINKRKLEGHTTQIVYSKEEWIKFKHILEFEGTNTNRFLWNVVEIVLEEYDQKEHSLDKYLVEPEAVMPKLDAEPEKIMRYLQTLPMDKVKEFEEKFLRNHIYTKAITQGEVELENFPYLWRKYHV